eukprot:g11417.t1
MGRRYNMLAQLRELLRVASALTFAVRSASFNAAERKKLTKHTRETVGGYEEIHGRGGVHFGLHYEQAIEDHGRMPDASVGEAAHQMNKKVEKSNSGRNAAAPCMQSIFSSES